jgi:hypothetical protein
MDFPLAIDRTDRCYRLTSPASPLPCMAWHDKMKMIYNNTSILDRLLSNGHKSLSHFGDLRAKIRPGTLIRPSTPIDTPICNVCRRSSVVNNVSKRSICHSPPSISTNTRNKFVIKKSISTKQNKPTCQEMQQEIAA